MVEKLVRASGAVVWCPGWNWETYHVYADGGRRSVADLHA